MLQNILKNKINDIEITNNQFHLLRSWERIWVNYFNKFLFRKNIIINFHAKVIIIIYGGAILYLISSEHLTFENSNNSTHILINGFSLTYGLISFFLNSAFPYPGNNFIIILLLFNIWFACFIEISSCSFFYFFSSASINNHFNKISFLLRWSSFIDICTF